MTGGPVTLSVRGDFPWKRKHRQFAVLASSLEHFPFHTLDTILCIQSQFPKQSLYQLLQRVYPKEKQLRQVYSDLKLLKISMASSYTLQNIQPDDTDSRRCKVSFVFDDERVSLSVASGGNWSRTNANASPTLTHNSKNTRPTVVRCQDAGQELCH